MPLSLSETLFRPEFIDAENRTILSAEFIYPFFFEISSIFDKASYNGMSFGAASSRIGFASLFKDFASITFSFLSITSPMLGFISTSI